MVVAGTASLAGLSAIVTGVALTGEHPVTNAGPTTGATPLIQVDEARHAFGSDDAQASRGSREPLLPPQVSDPVGDTFPTGSGTSTSTGPIGQEYGYQHYTRQDTPAPPVNPGTTGATGEEGLSGYEIPFVPLTPQTSAAPTPGGSTPPAGTTADPATGGTTTGGTTTGTTPGATPGGTTTGGTTTAPGTTQPGGTATPRPTAPATKPASGGTTTPTTPRPSSSTSTTPPPSTTPEDEEEGSLPFNPEPVQVTPIWDSLFPPATSGSTATSSSATR